jgi:hypothetical protein
VIRDPLAEINDLHRHRVRLVGGKNHNLHILAGAFSHGIAKTVSLAIGGLLGAQVRAHLSNRFKGVWLIRSFALALGLVAIQDSLQRFVAEDSIFSIFDKKNGKPTSTRRPALCLRITAIGSVSHSQ